jgi:hypothetical protein
VLITNGGQGNGLTSWSTLGNGLTGFAWDMIGAGITGSNFGGGEGVVGYTASEGAAAVVGVNDGSYAAVRGVNNAFAGMGMLAVAGDAGTGLMTTAGAGGNALVADITGSGNAAVFKTDGVNVARIDDQGTGYFNGGTVNGGADVAEYFDVEGNRNTYEAGDVLVISANSDRTVERSSNPYSTLVAGVYATAPGLLLTERNAEKNELQDMVPMGVIGVIPTKVCLEGGPIRRGDLLVTSSVAGVAMKADPDKVRVGQVLGKALQDYSGTAIGKIKVLVSVK